MLNEEMSLNFYEGMKFPKQKIQLCFQLCILIPYLKNKLLLWPKMYNF